MFLLEMKEINKGKSQEINEQIEYGLENISSKRMIRLSLKDFLYTYKSVQEFVRFFHQQQHYSTLLDLHLYLGNTESGAFSVLDNLNSRILDKYVPEDIVEEIENGNKLTHPKYPYYYNLKKEKIYNISAAGNTEPPSFALIKEMGFDIVKENDIWISENYKTCFKASSPLELLGLITLYQAKGEHWNVSDDTIDQFVELDKES